MVHDGEEVEIPNTSTFLAGTYQTDRGTDLTYHPLLLYCLLPGTWPAEVTFSGDCPHSLRLGEMHRCISAR